MNINVTRILTADSQAARQDNLNSIQGFRLKELPSSSTLTRAPEHHYPGPGEKGGVFTINDAVGEGSHSAATG